MVGSAAIKQGRSANRKHTFFWPYCPSPYTRGTRKIDAIVFCLFSRVILLPYDNRTPYILWSVIRTGTGSSC